MNKKNFFKVFFAPIIAGTVLFQACTAEENEGMGRLQKRQTLSIEVVTGQDDNDATRSDYVTSGSTVRESFVQGDEIGVYGLDGSNVIADNIKFTLNSDGNWEPERDVDYSTEYVFYAYYPYKPTATLTSQSCRFDTSTPKLVDDDDNTYDDTTEKFASFIANWPIPSDQSDVNVFRQADLLAARGQNQSIPVVRFSMAHRMGLIQLVPSYNKWFYAFDLTTAQQMKVNFIGNKPYELDENFYYICRPNTDVSVGGFTLRAAAGKFYYKRIESMDASNYNLAYSTDGVNYNAAKPAWMSVTNKDDETYAALSVGFIPTSTGTVVGTTLAAGTESSYDLSTHDVNGKACAQTTANCYMIHKGGTYKLPLVYGNAIKNGATNTDAFNPSGSGANFLSPFMSALGNNITKPWIKDVDGAPTSAELLWQDAAGIVTAVAFSGDYLTFTVPANAPCGNAVIAVKNSEGIILWSWHIWACPDWYTTESMTPVTSGDYTYKVTPVNLGWVGPFTMDSYTGGTVYVKMTPKSGNSLEHSFSVTLQNAQQYTPTSYGYCPYYQWGRKDPEQPTMGNSNAAHPIYDISGTATTAAGHALTNSQSSVPISETIKNPTIHYYNSDNIGPYSTNPFNLWDAKEMAETNSGNRMGHTVKTIYDPCPPGYCVPRGNLYAYMTNSGTQTNFAEWNSSVFFRKWTRNFPAINFPAAGNRDSSNGTAVYNVAGYGYCWTSSASRTTHARYLNLNSGSFYWSNYTRACGFSVRPVAEN